MPIVEFSVVPIGTESTSVSKYVVEAVKTLKKYGNLRFQVTPMGTVIEGNDLSKILEAILEAHEAVFKAGAQRVVTSIKIDDRRDRKETMEYKVKAVKEKI
ncbi:MAG: MTH1187 family thiamine-binding protein [Candidatus Baldrarchaeia archaeon]